MTMASNLRDKEISILNKMLTLSKMMMLCVYNVCVCVCVCVCMYSVTSVY